MRTTAAVTAMLGTAALGPGTAVSAAAPADDRAASWWTGSFVPAGRFSTLSTSGAVTYDETLVPVGAAVGVRQRTTKKQHTVELFVRGVAAGHTFDAHVHTRPCGKDPADAGGHYQHRRDPVQPSVDPRYANPRNEVWLGFTADGGGEGAAQSTHRWTFRAGEARSVVLHSGGPASRHGNHSAANASGNRIACFTVPFGSGRDLKSSPEDVRKAASVLEGIGLSGIAGLARTAGGS